MATLTDPINAQNIVDRFSDYVVSTANSGISWGTNAIPFPEMSSAYFGGGTGGRSIGITGSSITPDPITANKIYTTLVNETYNYFYIRNMRAIRNVTGAGGNTPLGPQSPGGAGGYNYDVTAVAYNNDRNAQDNALDNGVASGSVISSPNLEAFLNACRAKYNSARTSTRTVQIDVCHASCHSSCHGSRGRR